MKSLKYFLFILSVSFTSVIIINALFQQIGMFGVIFNSENVIVAFVICAVIAFLCVVADQIPIINDYPMIYSYVLVMVVAMSAQYYLNKEMFLKNIVSQAIFLTLVYIIVWLGLYINDYKEVEKINKKINER